MSLKTPSVLVERRPRFVDDVTDCYRFLRRRSPRAAERMLGELERVVALLAAFPEMGRKRDNLRAGARSFPVRRFRHVIYYRIEGGTLMLVRFLYGGRKLAPEIFVEE